MKKIVFGLSCGIFIMLLSCPIASAEEAVIKNTSESTIESSDNDSSTKSENNNEAITETIDSSAEDDTIKTIRQSLLECVPDYGLTKELLDSLSDEQLENAKNVSLNFGSQHISGTAKFILKIYGSSPIPKESYSLNYRELTVEEMKQYIPQIRLSLIYGFDLDENLVNSITNQQFFNMINDFSKSKPEFWADNGMFVLLFLNQNITEGTYYNDTSESSTENVSVSASTDSEKKAEKKGIFPNTGEQRNKLLTTIGISIIALLIGIVVIKNRKKHS
ncbi:LPXTG cell wall anchor domain-containing protein [Enterococcus sp. LJL99]